MVVEKSKLFDAATSELIPGVNLVEASAGTGKTYTIAMLVLRFVVECGFDIEEILLVTFTRAAAEELGDRIRLRLVEARKCLSGIDQPKDPVLANWINALDNRQEALLRIERALSNVDRAAVYTIHSFCQRMLQEQALESGQLFDIELQPDVSAVHLEAVKDFWRKKIYFLSGRVCSLVLDSYPTPERLLQSVPLVGELVTRIEPEGMSLNEAIQDVEAKYNSFALWWKKQGHILASSMRKAVDEGKMKKEFSEGLENWKNELDGYFRGRDERMPPNLEWLTLGGFSEQINKVKVRGEKKSELLDSLALPNGVANEFFKSSTSLLLCLRKELVLYLRGEIEKRLKKSGKLSYDDLITHLYRSTSVNDGQLNHILQQRFKAVLIDEFQDTDLLQWSIFSKVFGGGKHYLFLIGDPKQAIYRFRGADIHSYFLAREKAVHLFSLGHNYRSHPALVEGVNRLFLQRENPFVYEKSILDFAHVEPAIEETEYAILENGEIRDNLFYCQLKESEITQDGRWSSTLASEKVENFVVSELSSLLSNKMEISIGEEKREIRPNDIAILVRKHSTAEKYQQRLRQIGIPAVIASKQPVFSTDECKELYTLLKALAEPVNVERLKQAMCLKWFGFNGDELYLIWKDDRRLQDFHFRFQDYARMWSEQGILVMLQDLFINESVLTTLSNLEGGMRKITNILHLSELIQKVEGETGFGPVQIVLWLKEKRENPDTTEELRLENDDDSIKIITLHGAKGLEYPVVFCPDLWYRQDYGNREPLYVTTQDSGDVVVDLGSEHLNQRYQIETSEIGAEELRLLYVAITRAKIRCYLIWADVKGRKAMVADSLQSGLGYLLFAHEKNDFREQQKVLQDLAAGKGCMYIALADEYSITSPNLPQTKVEKDITLKRSVVRTHFDQKRISSYSSLADSHEIAHLSGSERGEGGVKIPFVSLPSGASFGNVVHDVLEKVEFQSLLSSDEPLQEIVETMKKYRVDADLSMLSEMLRVVVSTPLIPDDEIVHPFALVDVASDKMLKEMGFHYRLKGKRGKEINRILADQPDCRPITESMVEGFLTGFVDLIFEHQQKFYIVDYKTNNLGDWSEPYAAANLTSEMAMHNYGLQYWLYSIVLNRKLKSALPGYNYERNFGGIFYLFVRGLKIKGHGQYFHRPALDKLEALERCFEGE